MVERRLSGRSASTGLAIGPLLKISRPEQRAGLNQGTAAEEETALRDAMAKAVADLHALADVAEGDGADILAFQIEMLADPALIEDVLIEIRDGKAAQDAWNGGLDEQIQGYEAADDDFFRARASDLSDLKNRVARTLMGIQDVPLDLYPGAILLDHELTPSQFLALDLAKLGGIALFSGSANSHVAMLARARGIPVVVGLGGQAEDIEGDDLQAIIDSEQGLLILAPTARTNQLYRNKSALRDEQARVAALTRFQPAMTRDGQSVDVMINVDDPSAIDDDSLKAADGIGLLRTEFLFLGRADLPDENEQYCAYAALADRLAGRSIIIRTLDIGGDKPLPAVHLATEANPFLGLRGIRLCLVHEALFRTQVRALLRATPGRALKVMLPMVTTQLEIDRTKALFEDCLSELQAEGMVAEMPPIGIMIETPAAAIAIDRLDAAFYSIGSNDLIQYVMAAARDASGPVADLLDPTHPAIGRLIEQVVAFGRTSGKEVSLCGDMASDSNFLEHLLHLGLRRISVAPAALDRVKSEIAQLDLNEPLMP